MRKQLVFVVKLGDVGTIVRQHELHTPVEGLSLQLELVPVADGQFPSGRLHVGRVLFRLGRSQHAGQLFALRQHAFRVAAIDIEGRRQLVIQQPQIDPAVQRADFFPCIIRGDERRRQNGLLQFSADHIAADRRTHGRDVSVFPDKLVAQRPVGSTDFQLAEHRSHGFEKRLCIYTPSCGCGGEEAIALFFREAGGPVITSVQLHDVSVIVGVVGTEKQASDGPVGILLADQLVAGSQPDRGQRSGDDPFPLGLVPVPAAVFLVVAQDTGHVVLAEAFVEGRIQIQHAVKIVCRAFIGFAIAQLPDIIRPVTDRIFVLEPVILFASLHKSEVGIHPKHLFPKRHFGREGALYAVVFAVFLASVDQLRHRNARFGIGPRPIRVLIPIRRSQIIEKRHIGIVIPFLADPVAVDIGFPPAGKIAGANAFGCDIRGVVGQGQPLPDVVADFATHAVAPIVVVLDDTGQDAVLVIHAARQVETGFLARSRNRDLVRLAECAFIQEVVRPVPIAHIFPLGLIQRIEPDRISPVRIVRTLTRPLQTFVVGNVARTPGSVQHRNILQLQIDIRIGCLIRQNRGALP